MMKTKTTSKAAFEDIRAAFDEFAEHGEGGENFDTLAEAASRADVRGDVAPADEAMSKYETSARAFLTMTGAKFSARYLGAFDSFEEWGEDNGGPRYAHGDIPVWRVTISAASGRMSVRFRGSIHDGQNGRTECGVYDVLACLTKSEPGTFDEFANEYGYFPISSAAAYRHARRVFAGCVREFRGVCRVWSSEEDRARLATIA